MEKNLWINEINKFNSFHPTIKFTADYSKETTNFLDVNIRLVRGGGGGWWGANDGFAC